MIVAGLYAGLFLVAFGAATILPLQSEAAVVGMVLADHDAGLVVLVAGAGNTLGAATNWLLGRGVERFRHRRWFPVGPGALRRAEGWYRRYGRWSLLLSWLPLGGDALTIVAGVLREPLAVFLLLVAIGKIGRYVVVVGLALGLA
ncbi:membrane protein YqaA with SNARE-associated domain [Zavarzinia compransoris]|uniref:VTT domain-containing protein n=2 Tax=Zavarzinia compransoris TaxID=1264899 RepID=A0A317EFY5_9PROT|nr:hypothetical protein DKG75_04255 [Zavarzinia compransoris]TDP48012.1 membrane protein YqaA with SNARE-associated domain [Zavarzinia compransoris]